MPARGTFAAEWPKNRPRSRSRLGIMGIKRPLSRAVENLGRFRRSLQTPHPPPHRPPGVADEPPQPTRSAMRVGEQLDRVIIYTILGRADLKGTPAFKALQQAWESLRVCYRKQDWAGGRKMLEACRSCSDGPQVAGLLEAYAARIDGLEASPPKSGWDGVYAAETK
jgi:hypothetical protein